MLSSTSKSASTSTTGKLTPNLDKDSTNVLNLTVLQRIDHSIEEILMIATHVSLYQFNIDLNQWSRKDVEGSLFVVKRTAQPRFQFIVMNRRSTDNLVEDLLSDFEFEIQVPYLLYRNAAQEVNGIWFYNAQECEDISNLFNRIINAYSKVSPKQEPTPSRREFEVLEAVPGRAVIEGPVESSVIPPTVSTARPEDPSFMNLFSTAMNIGHGHGSSNGLQSGQVYHVSNAHPSHVPTPPVPLTPATYAFAPMKTPSDRSDLIRSSGVANLVVPSSFLTPSSSSSNLMPPVSSISTTPLHPLLNLHQPHGTPMLQPFPPPNPPPTLTANPAAVTDYTPLIREKVRDALVNLVQDNQFVDMVYQALMRANQS